MAAVLGCSAMSSGAAAQSALDYAGRWTLDDCTTTSAALKDVSGNNQTAFRGLGIGCTADADGRSNGAVNFVLTQAGDGTNANTVIVNNPTATALTGQVAVSAKIKTGAVPAGAIVTKGFTTASGAQKTFQLAIEKDTAGVNRLVFRLWVQVSGSAPLGLIVRAPGAVPAGVWTQVGASYDPTNGFQMFVNDVKVLSGPVLDIVISEAPAGTSSKIWLGGNTQATTAGYLGAIDDVWVSNGGCVDRSAQAVVIDNELMITKTSVVDDARASGVGPWSFGGLAQQMVAAAPPNGQTVADAAADMVEAMFRSFDANQTVVGTTVASRKRVGANAFLFTGTKPWPRTATGKLDLSKSPLRLLAIVARLDLRNLSKGHAGEGRFVFNVLNQGGVPSPFNVILEYRLPAKTKADVRTWAKRFHDLSGAATPAAYNTALQAVTDAFSSRGADPKGVNGNALNQFRTNEIALDFPWELRQFSLGREAATGATRLVPAGVTQTPLPLYNDFPVLSRYLEQHAAAVMAGQHVVDPSVVVSGVTFRPFQAGSSLNDPTTWTAPDIVAPAGFNASDLRFNFAVNTCSGCHNVETGTPNFVHLAGRQVGAESARSGFLRGITVTDPVDHTTPRTFADLARRQTDLKVTLGCGTTLSGFAAARTASGSAAPATTLEKGIDRTH